MWERVAETGKMHFEPAEIKRVHESVTRNRDRFAQPVEGVLASLAESWRAREAREASLAEQFLGVAA